MAINRYLFGPTNQRKSRHTTKFATKRNTPEDADGVNENYSEPTSKKTRPQPQTQQENLTKFSVEIVQQLEFTTSASNSQISTNVTVKALNTSVKSDLTQTSGSPRPPSPRNADPVECKQEPDNPGFVDLEQCAAALEKDAAANGGNSFPGFSDLIGDDTSSDALKDLISWEITDIDPEFMDFNFDGSDSKIQPEPQQLPPQVQPQQRPNFKTEENDLKGCRVDSRAGPAQCRQPRTTRPYGPNLGELSEAELSPAAQTLKQMAEQHQHKTQLAVNFPPKSPYEFQFNNGNVEFVSSPGGAGQQGFKQGTPPCTFTADNIKQEVFSGGRGSPVGYGGIPSPQATRGLGAQFKQQYSPYGSPGAHGSPQYCTRPPQHQQQQQQQQQHQQQHQQQQQQQQPQQQQPPPRPSSGSATLLQVNQAQQLQITQTQGQQIQVSMAQNLSAEMKTSNSGGVSVASQQGLYMTGNQESAGTSYCNVSQSQTVNFTQQGFRQRVPPRHQLIRTPHSGVDIMQSTQVRQGLQQQLGIRPVHSEFSNNKGQHQSMLHAMVSQRFSSQPRMPPSGPMMRSQQNQYMPTVPNNVSVASRTSTYGTRLRQPTALPENEWRQMVIQQNRPQFHQAQGVTFGTNSTQLSAGQMQHMSRMAQHQTLAMHHTNPPMSVSVQMNQSMGSTPIFNTVSSRQPVTQIPSYSPANYTTITSMSTTYPTSAFTQQPTSYQQSANSIPSGFSLDFFEHLPTSDATGFSEQELLSSLEPGTSFNLQDIL